MFPLIILIPGFALNIMISLSTRGDEVLGNSSLIEEILVLLLIILLPLSVCIASFKLCNHFVKRWQRFCILYMGWFVLGFSLLFLLFLGIGGMSQASVEGVISSYDLYLQTLMTGLIIYGWLHIFIVPWILLIVFRMKQPQEKIES